MTESVGVHDVMSENKGFKPFTDCQIQQTWSEWLRGHQRTSDICWSEVFIKKGARIVRPYKNSETGEPDDLMRTDQIHIGQIVTPCGQKCVKATSVNESETFESNKMYTSQLDTDLIQNYKPGLKFFQSLETLKNHDICQFKYGPNTFTTRNKNGDVIKTERSDTGFQY